MPNKSSNHTSLTKMKSKNMKKTITLIILILSTCFLSAQKGNPNSDYKVKWNTGTENSREVCPQNNTRNYRFNNASAQACDNTANRTIRQRAKVTLTNIGLDIPIFITRSLVDVPNGLRGTITDHFGGVGYDFGLGLNLDFSNNMSLKFGLHKWNKSFNANYNAFAEGLG